MRKRNYALSLVMVALILSACQVTKNEDEQTTSAVASTLDEAKNETLVETKEEIEENSEIENNNFYKDVTSLSKKEVEMKAREIKELYINNDLEAISKMMDYPIYFDSKVKDFTFRTGGKKINNEKEFMECVKDLKVSDKSIEEMKNETCVNMFAQPSSGGICFGEGVVWMRDVNFDGAMMQTNGTPTFKIFALSGLE